MTRFGATPFRLGAAPDARVFVLPGDLDRPVAAEAQLAGGRGGEVVLAPAHVGPAVDDRNAHDAAAVAERHLRAARERLVGHAQRARLQRSAAAQLVAEKA